MIQYGNMCLVPSSCTDCAVPEDVLQCSLQIGLLCFQPQRCTSCPGGKPKTDHSKCPCDLPCPTVLLIFQLCTAEACGCPSKISLTFSPLQTRSRPSFFGNNSLQWPFRFVERPYRSVSDLLFPSHP
ncbi:hypothetical protein FKM82_018939 [Ascaphus truei]